MVTSRNFAIVPMFDYNCTMFNCCTFASLVKFDFNSFVVTFFTITSLVIFDYILLMVTSCIGLLSPILSFKILKLKFNLPKTYWNVFNFIFASRDDMLRKVI